ncbi:MAG: MarR family winged helix-turn-helix transcriptional regulator [Acetatifactor sp.]
MEEKIGGGENQRRISFTLRAIHNQIKAVVRKSAPKINNMAPQSQLQGGILGFLYHWKDGPVYQKDIEKEFDISRATATNTLQVMEKNGLIVRKCQDKDARLKRIFMTPEAEANHVKVEAHMKMMDDRMLRGMSDEDIEELNRLLGIIMTNLEEMRSEYSAETENSSETGNTEENSSIV